MNRRPIGVFDSGVGGLTVVHELMRQLPHEALIYFGDTARVPYGNKSPDTVRRYSREILDILLGRDVKLVVVACNTASAHALEELERYAPVPVEGVVRPGARAAVAATRSKNIGVIGTAGTMRSGAYDRAIKAVDPAARVTQRDCPLFVPFVEEGWLDHPATKLVAHEYLDPLRKDGIDTLVLGCTHYPLLKPLLGEVMGPDVRLIDSAEETAAAVSRELARSTLHAPDDAQGRVHFVVSDAPGQFEKVGAAFLGERVRDVETMALGEARG
ncbi:MAG: glutamate racemase [Gemmatimonadetes bacterium]|nr:glutamate racemase [Gemmatimonadota bacterium]